jgi:hypothetical protein
MRNRIINGAMTIDQRYAGASRTVTGDGEYVLDRWKQYSSQSSKYSVQQNAGSVTPPVGFQNYLGVTSLSSYSVSSGDYFLINQAVEGFNFADLDWGTANAQPVTLRFWVRSSLTGTFGGSLLNSGFSRTFAFTYTISAANTWEQKTVTITGCPDGTWLKTNGIGVDVRFVLGCGSSRLTSTIGSWVSSGFDGPTGATSVVGTNGATFYITGVQLEEGTAASPFENRLYGTELNLCQRYCQIIAKDNEQAIPSGWSFSSSTELATDMRLIPPMRTVPTLTQTATAYRANSAGLNGNSTTAIVLGATESTVNSARLSQAGYSGATAGQGATLRIYLSGAGTYFGFTAEL